jgi:serine/threonine protein kinase
MAPECHLMQSYDEKVDIWSFGMLLFELTTFQVPYAETEFLDVKERIVKGELPDLSHILVHLQPLKKIILNCLQFQAKLRPTANELIEQLNHVNISQ